jgi:hypothetical protein
VPLSVSPRKARLANPAGSRYRGSPRKPSPVGGSARLARPAARDTRGRPAPVTCPSDEAQSCARVHRGHGIWLGPAPGATPRARSTRPPAAGCRPPRGLASARLIRSASGSRALICRSRRSSPSCQLVASRACPPGTRGERPRVGPMVFSRPASCRRVIDRKGLKCAGGSGRSLYQTARIRHETICA